MLYTPTDVNLGGKATTTFGSVVVVHNSSVYQPNPQSLPHISQSNQMLKKLIGNGWVAEEDSCIQSNVNFPLRWVYFFSADFSVFLPGGTRQ